MTWDLFSLTLLFITLGGVEVVAWATKAEDLASARLLAGAEVRLELVVGPVDQVGMVLPAEGQVSVPPVAVAVLVGIADTEDTSNERAQEVTTTGTQNDHDTRFVLCNCTPAGDV